MVPVHPICHRTIHATLSNAELARAYAKGPKPERSVLFLAVTAEEKGLLGSEYYADNPLRPLATTAGRNTAGWLVK